MHKLVKRLFNTIFLVFIIASAVWGYTLTKEDSSSSLETITIGYQAGDPIDIAKTRGQFIKKMKKAGYKVVFKQFQNGSAEMEALASGNIDYARTGDTPPVTALASGSNITFVAAGSSKAKGSGIVATKSSGIKSISDLKGKKIAYTSNTSSQYMIMQVLKKAGLSTSDVTLVDMSQSDASVAFSKGKIDAWTNWDPYTSSAELTYSGAMIVTGTTVGASNRDYIISGSYAKKHQAASKALIKYLGQDMTWANTHKTKLVKMMTKSLKLPKKVVERMVNRRSYSLKAVSTKATSEEQAISDSFYTDGITKKKVKISKYVLNLK